MLSLERPAAEWSFVQRGVNKLSFPAVALLALLGCHPAPDSGVRGMLLGGGTITEPPPPGALSPSPGTIVIFRRQAGSWGWVGDVGTDGTGRFSIALPPGEYVVEGPKPPAEYSSSNPPVLVRVKPHKYTVVMVRTWVSLP
jgi:hypothetical protein